MEEPIKRRPEVLIVIEEGVAEHIAGPDDVDVRIIDFDTDGASADDLIDVIDQYSRLPAWMKSTLTEQIKRVHAAFLWTTLHTGTSDDNE